MDSDDRLTNAEQHEFELHRAFSMVERRVRELEEHRAVLQQLREDITTVDGRLAQLETGIGIVRQALSTVARKEEIEQLSRKLDTVPFELFATKKDLR